MNLASKYKRLIVSTLSALVMSMFVLGAAVPVSAKAVPPVVASQCTHPGWQHFGFPSKQACLDYVAAHSHQHGHGYGGDDNGQGDDNHGDHNDHNDLFGNVFAGLGHISDSFVGFFGNLFHHHGH